MTFFLVFLPGGHIALPIAVCYLRFVNPAYSPSGRDYTILACTILALGVSWASWLAKRLSTCLLSVPLYGGALAVAWHAWGDQDDPIILATAAPFLGTAGVIGWRAFRARDRSRGDDVR